MKAEQQLQAMMDEYPGLFRTRKDCINQLFCVIGNGYEWRAGQIVSKSCKWMSDSDLEDEWKNGRDYLKGKKKAKQKKADPFAVLERMRPKYDTYNWYPLCKYSLIFRIPKDVKSDWRDLADECKKMLIADGIDFEAKRDSL